MQNKPNDGGPAFPVMAGGALHDGASLRDYFAAKMMPSQLAREEAPYEAYNYSNASIRAYRMADAMLAAREVIK